jgi:hypothetical protein
MSSGSSQSRRRHRSCVGCWRRPSPDRLGGRAVHGGRLHCTAPWTPPRQAAQLCCLEGEVGEVVDGEPKTLSCWVWPQHADDRLVREALDERRISRSPREDVGTTRPGEGTPSDGLRRPGVDEAEGAEAQGGPRGQRNPVALHTIRWWCSSRHTMFPYLVHQLSGFSIVGQ